MVEYISKYTYEDISNRLHVKDDVNFDIIRTKGNRVVEFFWESMFQSLDMRYERIGSIYFFIYNSKEDELYIKEFKEIFK